MSVKFSGINILARNPAESFEFYKGLGLAVKEGDKDPNCEWYGATFDLGGADLWIWRDHSGNTAENAGRTTIEIVIGCEDIHKSHAEFKAKGYAVTEPEKMFYGGWEMNLIDPDGNKILFLD